MKLGFIGTGNMAGANYGEALLKVTYSNRKKSSEQIFCTRSRKSKRTLWNQCY